MAVQRFLPDTERTRRVVGWFLILPALVFLGWLAVRIFEAGRVNITAVVLILLGSATLALGFRLAFRHPVVIELDLENRKFNVVRDGSKQGGGTIDSLGPLSVYLRSRQSGSGSNSRTVYEYVVQAAVHSKIDLYVVSSATTARRKMEHLARAWRVSCQSYGGAVRGPDDIDTPLHERLRSDIAAQTPKILNPETFVKIDSLGDGYSMTSSYRSWAPLQLSAIVLALALFSVRGASNYRLFTEVNTADPMTVVFAVLMGILVLIVLGVVFKGVLDTFFPGTVRVTSRGVAYRGSRMKFAHIEELISTDRIEIVGDRRTMRLATTFCPRGATDTVIHELQRLIVEVGSRT